MATRKEYILAQLADLDLSKYPYDEAHSLIQNLGKYASILTTFHKGKVFVRARVNKNGEEFNKLSDLSFKPANYNTTYQRASTPNLTMFYGALLPENIEPSKLDNSRIIGCCEVSDLFRNKNLSEGEQVVTFGKWVVKEDIHLLTIAHHNDFIEGNPTLKRLKQDFDKFILGMPDEMVKDSLMISEFFANQFAKSNILHDFDYLLSAIYSERVANAKIGDIEIAGVLYPSVRTEGAGFNVAITPE